MSDASSPNIVVINQGSSGPTPRRASSLALESIVEENHGASSTSTDGDIQSIELIDEDAEQQEEEEEEEEEQPQRPPRPSKRLSFAPDPVTYRSSRMDYIRSSRKGSGSGGSSHDDDSEEPADEHELEPSPRDSAPTKRTSTATASEGGGKMMSAVKRLTSGWTSSHIALHPSQNSSTSPAPSEFTNSDRASARRAGRGRTTLFSRGSTNFSAASSTADGDGALYDVHPTREHPCIKQAHYDALRSFVRGRGWRYTCYGFIFIMLFGSQIQELWLPKSWDTACDAVFTSSIVFLSLDIVFQSIVGESNNIVCSVYIYVGDALI